MKTMLMSFAATLVLALVATAAEFHVATAGNDSNPGTHAAPLKTIQRAADLAQPGDTITVHEGIYRERINPPRGGQSDARRITYQAAPGEKVEIRGSEIVKQWARVQGDVWKVTIPNTFFGPYNPYATKIRGDWFTGKGRDHHTGAVYLNGDWLIEAARLEDVMARPGTVTAYVSRGGGYLLNVAWLRPATADARRTAATAFAARNGTQNAPCAEGGDCIGFIEHGHWVRYDGFDFGTGTTQLEIRAASESEGGLIELRLDSPTGELLGTCNVPNTGGWQSWSTFKPAIKPTSGPRNLFLVFKRGGRQITLDAPLWFAEVDASNTTIYAQFPGANPNDQLVEINVRPTVFYPDKPGRNYITVRGFALRHAATNWAPPTAEQVGLIGTHWSKGWIIENNTVSHSVCSGIALGKHGDQFDNTSADTAEGYVKTIERAHAFPIPWTRENIGHHIVRNNHVSHCEQAGIVGSLGPAFSVVTGNVIHDIHVRQLFGGAEMAGIKFHAAIDTEISNNHIYRTCQGLWLDWMAQGTRVTGNLFHDNLWQDVFMEVNHGPYLLDNNFLLSRTSLLNMSEGGAFAHNLFAGRIVLRAELGRETPYHPAHSTVVAGLKKIVGGDDRYYNNILIAPASLADYDKSAMPSSMAGNVLLKGAKPSKYEKDALVADADPAIRLTEKPDGWYLEMTLDAAWLTQHTRQTVTTDLLGKAAIPNLPYERPDGSPIRVQTDYFGRARDQANPTPGPVERPGSGPIGIRVR